MARGDAILRKLAGALLALALITPAKANVSEDAVKAAYLFRFASFVTWPAQSFTDASSPIRICVVGADAFEGTLRRMVQDKAIDGRGFEVQKRSGAADTKDCHMLYVIGANVDATLRAERGAPVLTVTDAAVGDMRGIIHFVVVQDRVRFHIDEALADDGGLSISSRLLSLAVSVRAKAR